MYGFEVDNDEMEQVESLGNNWQALVELADRKDFDLITYKKNYALITKENVKTFKEEIKKAYEIYLVSGPGAESVDLAQGVLLLEESNHQC